MHTVIDLLSKQWELRFFMFTSRIGCLPFTFAVFVKSASATVNNKTNLMNFFVFSVFPSHTGKIAAYKIKSFLKQHVAPFLPTHASTLNVSPTMTTISMTAIATSTTTENYNLIWKSVPHIFPLIIDLDISCYSPYLFSICFFFFYVMCNSDVKKN